ncbi:phosphatase [Pontimonas salivibrio]|uniref:Phosphatase n=1 Tax=Pontimonas salivibrio TaxID=1159327 RepID=A0A2L2BPR2_9MICO|nr:histidine phosphatase family protein [Pontimonas salivibrio]AVG23656.1 phosphatase [Pontimonas salivibrio]
MTIIHIIRHGETVWHAENRYAGHTDVPLTARGVQQSIELVGWAKTAGIDRILSSDLSRARLTAEPLAQAAQLPLTTEPGLREVDFGSGEGLTAAEMSEQFPRERQAFEAHPASSRFPGGESGEEALERALPHVFDAVRDQSVNTIVFVIHSTLGRIILCEFLGIALDNYRRIFPKFINGALTTVELPAPKTLNDLRGRASLLALNAPPHL